MTGSPFPTSSGRASLRRVRCLAALRGFPRETPWNTRTTTAGAEHFALAMEPGLTRSEVVDTYLSHVPDVIEAAAVGFYQLEAMSGRVEAEGAQKIDGQAQGLRGFPGGVRTVRARGQDPVLEVGLARRGALDLLPSRGYALGCLRGTQGARYRRPLALSMEAPVVVCGMLFGTIKIAWGACHTLPSPVVPSCLWGRSPATKIGPSKGLCGSRPLSGARRRWSAPWTGMAS